MRALFANRAFVAMWLTGLLTGTVRWLETLAVAVYVFDKTGSPSLVAAMTLLRMLPLALFGTLSGSIAERTDRRRLMLASLLVMAAVSCVLAALATAGQLTLWLVALGSFLNGTFWTMDFSVRRTMLGSIVSIERVGVAMAVDAASANNVSRALGPALGGLLLAAIGLQGAYWLSLAAFLAAAGLFRLAPPARPKPSRRRIGTLAMIRQGLRVVRRNRSIAGILAVTVAFNIWGFPATSMVPVIGKDVLELSPFPVGLLMSAEGTGAFFGALLMGAIGRPAYYKRAYFGGAVAFCAMFLVFGLSQWAWLSATALLLVGVGTGLFNSMQNTLVFLSAPPRARSRMMGMLTVCIGTAPLGFIHVGLMADWIGAGPAVVVLALEGLVSLALCWLIWPEIR